MVFDHPVLVIAKVTVLLLGSAVAGLAFLSWRRTKRRFMLYLAVAFGLVALGSFAGGVTFEFLAWDLFASSALETAFVLCGLGLLAVLLRPRKVSA
jgi:heme A synthase